jgi:hypothetical protein
MQPDLAPARAATLALVLLDLADEASTPAVADEFRRLARTQMRHDGAGSRG